MGEPWSRLAAYALCRDGDGRILLTRCSTMLPRVAGQWTMPGGGVDWGEHPADAAVRELEEETGLVGRIVALRDVWSQVVDAAVTHSGDPGHMVGIVYEMEVVGGMLRDELDGTTDAAAWFHLADARALPQVPIVTWCLDLC